jgi:RNA polymerase sigma-70 factor (ECF subfamily)
MEDKTILRRLAKGSERALEAAVETYSSYVVAVIHNRSRGYLSPEDEEEIASDVFLSLWQHAGDIAPGHLRPWLGSVARNKTADRLRRRKLTIPLEENTVILESSLWEELSQKEQSQLVRQALDALKPQDREIFFRYYDLCQTTQEIGDILGMSPSTVRTRLSRGRAQLKSILCQGGILYENEN